MKRRILLAGALALLATPAVARPPVPLFDTPRAILSPPFVGQNGRRMTLENFSGKVVVLNVWATWCLPCREEMPTLDGLQQQLGGRDFHVIALSIDRGGLPVVRRFYKEIGIRNLDVYLAEDIRAQFALGILGLPTTILLNRGGQELGRAIGPAEWDSAKMISFFQSIIARDEDKT